MDWDKSQQLRHAAQCSELRFLKGGRRTGITELSRNLNQLGYDGCVASLSAEAIIRGWKEAGWIKISPNGSELCLTEAGVEQLARWQEEDALWKQGPTEEIQLAKRLISGQPATNLRKLAQVIGSGTVIGVHDPYTDVKALVTLQKLEGLGVAISKSIRILTSSKQSRAAAAIASYLRDLNAEKISNWDLRAYAQPIKPHRRFLILEDKGIITCGLSLNDINKDEVLDSIPANDPHAVYDRDLFNQSWAIATPVQ